MAPVLVPTHQGQADLPWDLFNETSQAKWVCLPILCIDVWWFYPVALFPPTKEGFLLLPTLLILFLGYKGDEGTGASHKGAGLVSASKRHGWEGTSFLSLSVCREESEDGPGCAQWWPAMGQEAQMDAHQVQHEHEEELLHCAVTEHWNRSPREAVQSPSLEIFQNHVDATPDRVLYDPFWPILCFCFPAFSCPTSL